ncbi:hypothetical protein A3A20_03120 [Candidatus Wolfebacteria bacterium RIFCSPLOWO2_01_FULL_45_19]|uniref:Uncharacterized protein n=1 Tax=Candidatus Wolfebacteria bacterium RIFCSPLOWO2_01_FULL_45_19 TaxID=1802557 RepID=A0A1F8DQ73_9BACT|nr:MAG: hypothetical protein UX23_C0008G0015 [Parcubacteria group bacterium GW2011_GWB1_45_9]OGM90777.1 MAG: hypothetical protein A3A20_03120 [Candidatus Wolfebacteria bacterium RIFCSPLOWO2_01_FULL_45_19]
MNYLEREFATKEKLEFELFLKYTAILLLFTVDFDILSLAFRRFNPWRKLMHVFKKMDRRTAFLIAIAVIIISALALGWLTEAWIIAVLVALLGIYAILHIF